jgi:aspartate aminotransferase-like enzyme
VLSVVNGAFSERFARIAEACGRAVSVLRVPDGDVADADQVEDALRRERCVGVTVVHSETSTGALTDIAALSAVAQRHGVPLVVDSVTGLAGAPVETDAWGLPFVLTGSQKALALPPGLAFGVAQPSFVEHARSARGRGLYLDVVEMAAFAEKRQTPNTPAVSLFYAAQVQVEAILAEGIHARWARHAAMAEQTWQWVDDASARTGVPLAVVAPPGARSPTVTAVRTPDGMDPEAIVRATKARGFVIGGGYGALKRQTFRVGHMGDHTTHGLARCLEAVEEAVREVAHR